MSANGTRLNDSFYLWIKRTKKMTEQDKKHLKLEIDHIFESGSNEIRIFEMVVNFIDSRSGVNKNFVLADEYAKGYRDGWRDRCKDQKE